MSFFISFIKNYLPEVFTAYFVISFLAAPIEFLLLKTNIMRIFALYIASRAFRHATYYCIPEVENINDKIEFLTKKRLISIRDFLLVREYFVLLTYIFETGCAFYFASQNYKSYPTNIRYCLNIIVFMEYLILFIKFFLVFCYMLHRVITYLKNRKEKDIQVALELQATIPILQYKLTQWEAEFCKTDKEKQEHEDAIEKRKQEMNQAKKEYEEALEKEKNRDESDGMAFFCLYQTRVPPTYECGLKIVRDGVVVCDGTENFLCKICDKKGDITKDVWSVTSCYHSFHVKCMDEHMKKSSKCPECGRKQEPSLLAFIKKLFTF